MRSIEEKKPNSAVWVAVITGLFALCGIAITAIAGPVIVEIKRNRATPNVMAVDTPLAALALPSVQPSTTPVTTTWTPRPGGVTFAIASSPPGASILFQESFDSNINNGTIGDADDPNYGFRRREIINGLYRFTATSKKDDVYFQSTVPNIQIKDFALTFDASMTNITGDLSSGLPAIQVIYHFNNESWCGIYLSYHHYMIRLSHNGVGKTLAAFTENQAINLNRNIRNSFSIATTAGKTTLSANGQPIISFNNENLDHDGPIKIGVGFTKANQTIVVEFDSIVVKSNP